MEFQNRFVGKNPTTVLNVR